MSPQTWPHAAKLMCVELLTPDGRSLPLVSAKLRVEAGGGAVESAREHRLSFDEIFAVLVARNDEDREAENAAAAEADRVAGDSRDASGTGAAA